MLAGKKAGCAIMVQRTPLHVAENGTRQPAKKNTSNHAALGGA